MDRTERTDRNGGNAVIALDCPWCAEPLRISPEDLADGLTCPACLVTVELWEEADTRAGGSLELVAA